MFIIDTLILEHKDLIDKEKPFEEISLVDFKGLRVTEMAYYHMIVYQSKCGKPKILKNKYGYYDKPLTTGVSHD